LIATVAALALSVSPARLAVVAPAARTVELQNTGSARVVVDVARRALDGRTSPTVLSIRPAHLVLPGRATRIVTVGVPARGAGPGDHQLILLFSARPRARPGLAVRLRLGVRVRIRVPGRLVRHVDIRAVRRRRRAVFVSLANRGNVTEDIAGRLSVTLLQNGRVLSRLRLRGPAELLPQTRRVVSLPYAAGAHGPATAIVELRLAAPRHVIRRRFRLRL
jgi:hypothetical protein